MLSILSHLQVKDGDRILIELDDPDYTILPKGCACCKENKNA